MLVVCPHCRAAYQVDRVDEDVIFVCHRCHAEFGFGEPPEDAEPVARRGAEADDALPLFEQVETSAADEDSAMPAAPDAPEPGPEPEPTTVAETLPDEDERLLPEPAPESGQETRQEAEQEPEREPDEPLAEPETGAPDLAPEPVLEPIVPAVEASIPDRVPPQSDEPVEEPSSKSSSALSSKLSSELPDETQADVEAPPAPRPPRARVLPWLAGVFLVIAGLGLWTQRDAWLDDPKARATLINLGLPLAIRDKDWRIPPASVHAEWVRRDDGSQVLVIEGKVENRLEAELPPPYIHVTVFDRMHPDRALIERTLPITEPPLMATIRRAPFAPPPEDALPVAPLGERGFVLVLEGLPGNAGEFALSPAARNP